MSAGSKSAARPSSGLVVKQAPKSERTAEGILQEREVRNARAKNNMILAAEERRRRKAMAMEDNDTFHEPGAAFKLLRKTSEEAYAAKEEEKEYGEYGTEQWQWDPSEGKWHDRQPSQEKKEDEPVEVEEHADGAGGEADDVQAPEEDDEKEEEDDGDGAPAEEVDDQVEPEEGDGKSGKRGGQKGSKPWWSRYGWKSRGGGKKGTGKGKYDDFGGEYCVGGYRAVNGQFYPQLGFQFIADLFL